MTDKTTEKPQNSCDETHSLNAAKNYHDILVNSLRKIEENVIQLLAVLLPAAVGFAWALNSYLENPNKQLLIFSVTVAAMLLLGWGLYYTLALSYVYRYLTLVLWTIEKKICLSNFVPDWDPDPTCKYSNILSPFSIAPAILRVHSCILSTAIIGLAVVYQLIENSYRNIVLLIAILIILIALVLAHNIYPCKFQQHYLEVKNKMEEKLKDEKDRKKRETRCCVGLDWIDILILSGLILFVILLLYLLKDKKIIENYLWFIIFLLTIFVFSFIQILRYCGVKWKKCCDRSSRND